MRIFVGFLLFFATFFPLQNIQAEFVSNDIVISEVNSFGSIGGNCKTDIGNKNRCSFDKWVELFNPTDKIINLENYTLKFKNSDELINNLNLPNFILDPQKYYLIAYNETDFVSNLSVTPDMYSGKIKNLSNQTEGTDIQLLKDDQVIQVFKETNVPDLSTRQSYEFDGESWILSIDNYNGQNYGTPRNSSFVLIKHQPIIENVSTIESAVTVEPMPEITEIQPPANQTIIPAMETVLNPVHEVSKPTFVQTEAVSITPTEAVKDNIIIEESKAENTNNAVVNAYKMELYNTINPILEFKEESVSIPQISSVNTENISQNVQKLQFNFFEFSHLILILTILNYVTKNISFKTSKVTLTA